ncbi:hypothetical protein [Deinococcus sedimenti]|uniref:Copper chaperone PCu(A)C n=1 Tax=Deinococcus sedimenti TaxID=1867090 RepID=A0ABQ2S6Z4_9DEIO|nr:hypothetical protein [Deinococcus sedimenti]GGR92243.1 hypothetical protein GCM10008960_18860 [Deinococcus sedimenti]
MTAGPPTRALLASALALLCSCGAPARTTPPAVFTRMDGAGLQVTLSGPAVTRGTRATVTLLTGAGTLVTEGRAEENGLLRVLVSYRRAGRTPFTVDVAGHRLRGEVQREPDAPVTPLTLKVGARAVRVTQGRPPALVLHPLDRHGNVTRLPVDVLIRRPDGVTLRRTRPVEYLTS